MAQTDWLMFGMGVLFLALSALSTYRPNLVWGDLAKACLPPERIPIVRRRQQIGTVVLFLVGAVLLVFSIR